MILWNIIKIWIKYAEKFLIVRKVLLHIFKLTNLAKIRTNKITMPYLWPRSKGWMRAHKRTFNLQRLKTQIGHSYLYWFVSLAISKN